MRFASNKIPTHFNVMPFRLLSIPNLYIYIFLVCITYFLSFYCRKTFPFRKEFTMETFKSHETYKRENWHDGHHQNFVYEYDRHDLHDDDHQWIQGSLMSQSLSVGNSTIWNMPKKKARTWKKRRRIKIFLFSPRSRAYTVIITTLFSYLAYKKYGRVKKEKDIGTPEEKKTATKQ